MRKISILIVVIFTVWSCGKEEIVTKSDYDMKWLQLTDDLDSPIDHALYNIYKSRGIPIYYNDTIGKQTRVDNWGNEYISYEKLIIDYSPDGLANPAEYEFLKRTDKDKLLPAISFIHTEVLNLIPRNLYLPSILLVNNVKSSMGNIAYRGLNTLLIGDVLKVGNMLPEELAVYKAAIFRVILISYITRKGSTIENDFFKLTEDCKSPSFTYTPYYPNTSFGHQFVSVKGEFNYPLKDGTFATRTEDVGCLITRRASYVGGEKARLFPNKIDDLSSYIEVVFTLTKEQFERQYGGFPICMQKYNAIIKVLREDGIKI